MKNRRKLLFIPVVLVMFAATAAGCDRDTAVADCLDNPARPTPIEVTQSGSYSEIHQSEFIADHTPLDAQGTAFQHDASYGAKFVERAGERDDLCLVGGNFYTTNDAVNATWKDVWHHRWGIIGESPDLKLVGTNLFNTGDAFMFHRDASNWQVVGARAEGFGAFPGAFIHDDCVENDDMHAGQILDSKFDGCHVFISATHEWGSGTKPDGSANELLVSDTLVRLQPMYNSFCPVTGAGTGCNTAYGHNQHGGFFKFARYDAGDATYNDGTPPTLKLTRVMLRADQVSAYGGNENGKMAPPPGTICEDVVLINTETWIPGDVDDWVDVCGEENVSFGDSDDWDLAVSEWDAAHPAL